ncbi:MAG: hypothetical protein P4M08_08905 [Oligoflexia bacterium]|nr:hypothetical protein [Oligoflexia bacterium]
MTAASKDSKAIKPSVKSLVSSESLSGFGLAGLIWLLLSAAICFKLSPDKAELRRSLTWLCILFGLSILDLFALAQALSGLFDLMRNESEKPIFLVFRTSYWASIKLVCLIFLGFLMARGSSSSGIPTPGLLTGISTLMVVPLLGGVFWQLFVGTSNE